MTFKPEDHIMKIKGNDYMQVQWRIVWMRSEHADWGIETEIVNSAPGHVQMKATIKDKDGKILAQGHKAENKSSFSDYLEKAETGAIGRALALCGYGTQFTGGELDEGMRLADSPVAPLTPKTPAGAKYKELIH